jgi:hypothetical protein
VEFQDHPAHKALPLNTTQEVLKKLKKAWNPLLRLLVALGEG